jgi:hypothetical protein
VKGALHGMGRKVLALVIGLYHSHKTVAALRALTPDTIDINLLHVLTVFAQTHRSWSGGVGPEDVPRIMDEAVRMVFEKRQGGNT